MIVAVWIAMIILEANGLSVPLAAWVILYGALFLYGMALGIKIIDEWP